MSDTTKYILQFIDCLKYVLFDWHLQYIKLTKL